jgi:hypothetical protein
VNVESPYREGMSPINELVRHDRRWKRKNPSQNLRPPTTETHSAGSAGARGPVGRLGCGHRGRWGQGSFPGVLLEFNELATLSRVDSENHALLAMPSLPAVEPHWVRVLHSE